MMSVEKTNRQIAGPQQALLTVARLLALLVFVAGGGKVSALPAMPLTFYGNVSWGDRLITKTDTDVFVSAWIDGREASSYTMGDRPTDWYILVVPMSSDVLPGIGSQGKTVEFRVNGHLVPDSVHTITQPPGSDIELPLQVPLVQLTVVSEHGEDGNARKVVRGAPVTESMPELVCDDTGEQWTCTGWTLAADGQRTVIAQGTGNSASFTPDSDLTLTWNWNRSIRVRLLSAIPGVGDLDVDGTESKAYVTPGASITVAAAVPVGYLFGGWRRQGEILLTETTATLTVQEPTDLVADIRRDADQDALPDEWEFEHFGTPERDHTAATDDFDGDGGSNALEHALGSSPADPESAVAFEEIFDVTGGVMLRWEGVVGRTFRVQRSVDAGRTWEDVSGPLTGIAQMQFEEELPAAQGHLYRLEVE